MMTLEEAIMHCEDVANDKCGCAEGCVSEHRQLAEWLKELQGYQWIPCSERLPKKSGEYLVYCEIFFIPDHVDETSSRKGMAITYYHREFNEWLGEGKVYAWMPLPEPYEPKEAGE